MEATLLHSPTDHQSLSLGKSKAIRNRNKSVETHPFVPPRGYGSTSSLYLENITKIDTVNKGVFLNPNCSPYYPIQYQQPPLLPIPILGSSRKFQSLPNHSGNFNALSPTHKKRNKGNKDQKKSKPSKQDLAAEFSYSKFSGSVYSMAPPPSSLPMPKFPVRMTCKADATGVDSGATDNLCRLLNLR